MTGVALGLFPSAVAMAQPSADDTIPNLRNRPSVESYSLPPGPSDTSDGDVVQGPVDAEIPIVQPPVAPPRTAPAIAPPESGNRAVGPAAIDSRVSQAQQPVRQVPLRPDVRAEISPPETDPPIADPAAAIDERVETAGVPDTKIDDVPSPSEALPELESTTAENGWYLFLVAALFFVLLGAMFLWRARRTSLKQPTVTKADAAKTGLTDPIAEPPEPLQPAPAIAIGFQPHSANATLFNAVVGFELTLSNHGGEVLTGIRVQGSMGQAGENGTRDPALADLSTFRELPALRAGQTEKIVAEFRIPLASIHPIIFRSQALFVPLVQISIEFTDGAGFQHFQTAAYLVGQEHQPPRLKMAPFRLDLGPRSFAPLGHRPFAAG